MNEIVEAGNALKVVDASVSMESLFERFAAYSQVQEVTLKSYGVCLRCFFDWMQDNDIVKPERIDIINFAKYLGSPHEKRGRTPDGKKAPIITFSEGTQARYLRAVKQFFEWTDDEGLYPNIARRVKVTKTHSDQEFKRDFFEKDDVLAILNSIDTNSETGKRDYAMVLLAVSLGLRTIEIQRLDINSIETIKGKHFIYIHGKGWKDAKQKKELPGIVYDALQNYLASRPTKDSSEALFVGACNRNRGRLNEKAISKILGKRIDEAGYESSRLTAHSLRHTSATLGRESGLSLQETKTHMRHSKIDTTCIYDHSLQKKDLHSEQKICDFLFSNELTPMQEIYKSIEELENIDLSLEHQKEFSNELKKLIGKYSKYKTEEYY